MLLPSARLLELVGSLSGVFDKVVLIEVMALRSPAQHLQHSCGNFWICIEPDLPFWLSPGTISMSGKMRY